MKSDLGHWVLCLPLPTVRAPRLDLVALFVTVLPRLAPVLAAARLTLVASLVVPTSAAVVPGPLPAPKVFSGSGGAPAAR